MITFIGGILNSMDKDLPIVLRSFMVDIYSISINLVR